MLVFYSPLRAQIQLVLTLSAVVDAAVLKQPVLRLRGGLGGVDAAQVASYAISLQAINGGMVALSPKKASEVYEMEFSDADNVLAEMIGTVCLGIAMALAYTKAGKAVATAVGYGMIPSWIYALKGVLNDDGAKFGQDGPIKYLNLIVSSVVTYTLLKGGPLDKDMTMKVFAGWNALNGLGMYFATDKLMDAWGAGSAQVNKSLLKGFGSFLTTFAVMLYMLVTGKDAVQTLGVTTLVALAAQIDGNFISKDAPGSANMQMFWMVVNAAVAAFTLF